MADYTASTSQALIRKSTDTELMPPPPPAKRIKRPPKVLDEDSYTSALSDIIARDFFPGLIEARHQEEYLDALASDDKEWIASAGRKLTEVMTGTRLKNRQSTPSLRSATPSATPSARGMDTPMTSRDDISIGTSSNPMRKDYDEKLSLDNFQAKFTSEDNASFNDLLDNQNQKRRDEYGWLWRGNKISKPAVIAEKRRQLLIKEREEKEGLDKTKLLEYQDDRPAMPETWKVNPRNGLMFSPNNLDDEMIDPDLNPATNTESRAAPKAISHSNTRMPPPRETANPIPPSPSFSAIRDAIAGKPRYSASETSQVAIGATPRVNGYSFVDDAPSPSPSELGLPPMTWGTIDDLLPTAETSPSPFKISETPRREQTLHKMVDKVAKSKRVSAKMIAPGTPGGSATGTPLGTAKRIQKLGSMTPAARGLLGKIGTGMSRESVFGSTTGRKDDGKTDGMRYRWTPTPRASSKGSATPLVNK